MKKLISRYALLMLTIAVSGGALMHTSQMVQKAEDERRALERSIEKEKRFIDVLEAEWSYLNSPQRLEILAQDYLDLVGPGAEYMRDDLGELPGLAVGDGASGPDSDGNPIPQAIYYKARKPERWER